MYIRTSHRPRSNADVVEIIRTHMFATLVTSSAGTMIASHLPILLDETRGEHGTLLAHMARANPQSAAIGSDDEVLVVFSGPHAYISPAWYQDRATAPTWDYIAVHCYGRSRRHSEEETLQNIARLVSVVEASHEQPWTLNDLSEQEIRALLQNVVSFEISITRIEGKFKLNQGEKPDRNRAAIAQLEQQGLHELVAYLRRYNDL